MVSHLRDVIEELPPDIWESPIAPGYWVAGIDVEMEGVWRGWDGRQIPISPGQPGFQNWYREGGFNEPSATFRDEDCLYISAILNGTNMIFPNILGRWLDSACFVRKYFICQADVPSAPSKHNYFKLSV